MEELMGSRLGPQLLQGISRERRAGAMGRRLAKGKAKGSGKEAVVAPRSRRLRFKGDLQRKATNTKLRP
jgi:hypothetical protein